MSVLFLQKAIDFNTLVKTNFKRYDLTRYRVKERATKEAANLD